MIEENNNNKNDIKISITKTFTDNKIPTYNVTVEGEGISKTFRIQEKGSYTEYNYFVEANNDGKKTNKKFVYFCDSKDFNQEFSINQSQETPNIDIRNIITILQQGGYCDIKNKRFKVFYTRPRYLCESEADISYPYNKTMTSESEILNNTNNTMVEKEIADFDYFSDTNKTKIYPTSNLLDKIALTTKQIGRWFSSTWADLQVWHHNRVIEANNKPASISLTSITRALKSAITFNND